MALSAWCLSLFTAVAQARGDLTFSSKMDATPEAVHEETLGKLFPRLPEPRYETVWHGLDIDGDGAPDFANPTGLAPRAHDAYGSGAFGASRDGGQRRHAGVDYAAEAGQAVVAPLSGYVAKIGFAYADDDRYRYVEIVNPALGYQARVFYIEPSVAVGDAVRVGDAIGVMRSLQGRYAGITDHVHLGISGPGSGHLDATRLIAARTVLADG